MILKNIDLNKVNKNILLLFMLNKYSIILL
jgi:hypothetical protein